MSKALWFLAGALGLAAATAVTGVVFIKTSTDGFSTHGQPTAIERAIATRARSMAIPKAARDRKNPIDNSPDVLAAARSHWADHCAVCHANDGSGQTTIGQHLYPPAPDMREAGTQQRSDGELFYIIENGIRLSGMPGWGGSDGGEDSWHLVHFIRHLPKLSQTEIQEMEKLNPKTEAERQEELRDEQFLRGEPLPDASPKAHHH
jgi:mono/diheme cytochrome c family protein